MLRSTVCVCLLFCDAAGAQAGPERALSAVFAVYALCLWACVHGELCCLAAGSTHAKAEPPESLDVNGTATGLGNGTENGTPHRPWTHALQFGANPGPKLDPPSSPDTLLIVLGTIGFLIVGVLGVRTSLLCRDPMYKKLSDGCSPLAFFLALAVSHRASNADCMAGAPSFRFLVSASTVLQACMRTCSS